MSYIQPVPSGRTNKIVDCCVATAVSVPFSSSHVDKTQLSKVI